MRGTRGWKAQRRAGGRDKKRGRGVLERPHSMPHWVLIQNGRHLIKKRRRLLQIPKKKKEELLVHTPSQSYREPKESICFITTTEHPSTSLREAGLKFVIYDNCFLQKCKYLMTIISREAHTACCDVFIRWGQRNCWSTVLLISGEESRAECGVKTVVLSHMNAYRHTYRQASLNLYLSSYPFWSSRTLSKLLKLQQKCSNGAHILFLFFLNSTNVNNSQETCVIVFSSEFWTDETNEVCRLIKIWGFCILDIYWLVNVERCFYL